MDNPILTGQYACVEPGAGALRLRYVKPCLMVTATILVLAACSSTHSSSASPTDSYSSPSTEVVVSDHDPATLPTLSPAQLRAHLGSGVPPTWKPVDYGDARLWVPPTWEVAFGACEGLASGFVETDYSYDDSCRKSPSLVKLDPIDLRWSAHGARLRVINGYRVFASSGDNYTVPDLHIALVARGWLADRVLATLAPSSRTVALTYHAARPSGWRELTDSGITFRVPPGWQLQDVTGKPTCPNPRLNAVVQVGQGLPAGCPPNPTYDEPAQGSLSLGNPYPSTHGATSTTIDKAEVLSEATAPWYTTHLQLTVRLDAGHDVQATLGLGRDGRIGAEIFAMFASVTRRP